MAGVRNDYVQMAGGINCELLQPALRADGHPAGIHRNQRTTAKKSVEARWAEDYADHKTSTARDRAAGKSLQSGVSVIQDDGASPIAFHFLDKAPWLLLLQTQKSSVAVITFPARYCLLW